MAVGARERVLDAALSCLTERGLERVTVEDVARRAGVARVTVYRHFEDRDALLEAAVTTLAVQFNGAVGRSVRSGGAPADVVVDYLVRSVDAALADASVAALLTGPDAARVGALFRSSQPAREALQEALGATLSDAADWVALLQLTLCTDALRGGLSGRALRTHLRRWVAPAISAEVGATNS